jgi:hypothetical protein
VSSDIDYPPMRYVLGYQEPERPVAGEIVSPMSSATGLTTPPLRWVAKGDRAG